MKDLNNLDEMIYSPVIYYLYDNKEIVYIGETTNLMYRIGQHSKTKIFDKVSYFVSVESNKQRKSIEASLIRKHKPKYNINSKKKKPRKVRLVLAK